jgi:exodeoxyribonuclease VII small subunit
MATMTKTHPKTNSAKLEPPSFEHALGELEGIVGAMETGQMPLQEALDAYRRGAELLRQCQETLASAERQIRILDGNELRDFETPQEVGAGETASGSDQEG